MVADDDRATAKLAGLHGGDKPPRTGVGISARAIGILEHAPVAAPVDAGNERLGRGLGGSTAAAGCAA